MRMKPCPLTTSSRIDDRKSVTSAGKGKVFCRCRHQPLHQRPCLTIAYPVDLRQRLAARLEIVKCPLELGDQFRRPFPLPKVRSRTEFVRCPDGGSGDLLREVLVWLDLIRDRFELTGGKLFRKGDGHLVGRSARSCG